MRVVLAPDSFKESTSAEAAARAMARGVARAVDAEVLERPMADGGEGTARTLVAALGGRLAPVAARDALGRVRAARVGVLADGSAVVESAEAIGLAHLAPERRDALAAGSAGLADLLRAAWALGARRVLVGLGGSATTDGGLGLLTALGARPLPGPQALEGDWSALDGLDLAALDPRLADVRVACDVTSPLTGPLGAAAVFAPQKGAGPAEVTVLERRLVRLARVLEAAGRDVSLVPGAGAAGGLGAAFLAAGAGLAPGVDLVADAVRLDDALRGADLVLTGEGRVDGQTLAGKVVQGVARRARAAGGVPVLVLAGSLGPGWERVRDEVGEVVPIGGPDDARPLAERLRSGEADLEAAAAAAVRRFVTARA